MTAQRLADAELERRYLCALLALESQQGHLREPERAEPADMSAAGHGAVLAAIHRLHRAHPDREVEPFDVIAELERSGGWGPLVPDLLKVDPWLGSLKPVAERLRKLRRDRELAAHLESARASLADGRGDDAVEAMLAGIDQRGRSVKVETETAYQTAATALANLCDRKAHDLNRSGFPLVDRAIGGFPRQTMAILGGDTGAGKSSLLLAMCQNLARIDRRCGIVSCEDAQAVWGPRVLAHYGEVNSERFFDSSVTAEFMKRCDEALERSRHCGIDFAYALNRPLSDVLAAIRSLVVEKQCRVIAVDYIQAIALPGQDRRIAIGNAAQAIKAECQSLGVPLILLSQLKRRDAAKEPNANDLKEAGELENCAEIVMLLWKTSDEENAQVLGKVAKVKWNPRRPRFEVQRNPVTGAVSGLVPYERPQMQAERPRWE